MEPISDNSNDCASELDDLKQLRKNLKSGEYDGIDIMNACMAIDDLLSLKVWKSKAFQVYPNIDIDIEEQ